MSLNVPQLRFPEFSEYWVSTQAKHAFSLFNGYAFSSKDASDEGCRWIKIADVGVLRMKSDTPSYLPLEFAEKYTKFLVKEGDYVVALTRPILSGELKIARIDSAHSKGLLNQRVGKLVTDNAVEFVYFLLQRRKLVYQIDARIAGTDPPNLAPSEIASLSLFVPSLPEQQKIADFLTAVDTRIGQLSQKKALLEDYKKGVMQQLFNQIIRFKDDDGNEYPDWEEHTLGSYMYSFRLGGNYSNSENITDNALIKMGNLGRGKISLKKVEYITSTDELDGEDLLHQGDLLFNTRNTLDLVGKVAIWRGEITNAFYNSNIMRLDFPNNWFMNYWFNSYAGLKSLRRIATGTTSVAAIYTRDLKKIVILVPDLEEQAKIVGFLSAIDLKIESVASQIAETKTFKKGLLQQMFV